jgi:N-acetylneuraminic acid mutarotase
MKWTEIKPTGELPKECSYSAGWYDSPYLFFFGGRNREMSSSDTYFLDTDTWIWRKIFSLDNPPARYHHSVVKTENKEAYMFGGYDEKRNRCLGDLFRYEYSMFV